MRCTHPSGDGPEDVAPYAGPMSPAPPPPISRWGHVWRYALTIAISALAWFELAPWQWENARWWFWLDAAVGVLGLVGVAWRRRLPVTVGLLTNLAAGFSASSGGPATLALFSLATRRRWREIVPVVLAATVAGIVLTQIGPMPEDSPILLLSVIITVVGITVGWGMFVGSRRELLATLRERARSAEAEQAAKVEKARTAERARIAREMHDVLAHRISMVAMHAGALAYRTDLGPEQVRTTAQTIQQSSHQAMVELREVLGVLREDLGDAVPERPQPDASAIPALLEEARAGGMKLRDDVSTPDVLAAVPTPVGRTLYRVVQEALTNARKHAPDTLVSVSLHGTPGAQVVVEVRNALPIGSPALVPQSGLGLVGLRERTELAGGTLRHDVVDGREFVLCAALPWPA